MVMNISRLFFLFLFLACFTITTFAQKTTTVTVRAKAKDAKFIGTSMSGAHITITDAKTGNVLSEGMTQGSTGDTERLMREPHERYNNLSTEGTAKYEASLQLDEPTFVTISAAAPMAQRQSLAEASTQLWLIPGKDISGDGIVLEIPGFAIDILQPQAHQVDTSKTIKVTANAVMMCGCPIAPDGLWDSNEMEFSVIIKREGKEVARKEMSYAGKTSTFEAEFAPRTSGSYEITVYGYDKRTGNTGLDKTTVISR